MNSYVAKELYSVITRMIGKLYAKPGAELTDSEREFIDDALPVLKKARWSMLSKIHAITCPEYDSASLKRCNCTGWGDNETSESFRRRS